MGAWGQVMNCLFATFKFVNMVGHMRPEQHAHKRNK